jgi:outer membrane protein OmpA-like peptidoglycan-associated protein
MLAGLFLSIALAQDALQLEAVRHAQVGLGAPSLTFVLGVRGELEAHLKCGTQTYSWEGPIRPGDRKTIELTGLAQGDHSCSGTVSLDADDGTSGEMPLGLQVWMHPPLTLRVDKQALDLEARVLTVHGSRPLGRVEIEVLGEGGHRIGSGAADGMVPESPQTLEWQQAPGQALKIKITAWDEYELPGRLELSPWSYTIPHEDVVFESGQAVVRDSEVPKLLQAWTELQEVRDRYGDVIEVRLYVAGYTDTVGDSASNRTLSANRAKAIAVWFRAQGFDGPIAYQGFGESVLAIPTADETDQPANRRAIYLLAADAPAVGPELPRDNWRKL